jgi:hypothetical protein
MNEIFHFCIIFFAGQLLFLLHKGRETGCQLQKFMAVSQVHESEKVQYHNSISYTFPLVWCRATTFRFQHLRSP